MSLLEICEAYIQKEFPQVPKDVIQPDCTREKAIALLAENPNLPFILRPSSVQGHVAIDFRNVSSPTGCVHRLITPDFDFVYNMILGNLVPNKPIKELISSILNNEFDMPLGLMVLSTQCLSTGSKPALSPEDVRTLTLKDARFKSYGSGHSGLALAFSLNAPFCVMRSTGNDEEASAVFKKYMHPSSNTLILTGHGNAGKPFITGDYWLGNENQGEIRVERTPDDVVSFMKKSGLPEGSHLSIVLLSCYGGKSSNGKAAYARVLGESFAKANIATTIYASTETVSRFGLEVLRDGKICFDRDTGMHPESIVSFETDLNGETKEVSHPYLALSFGERSMQKHDTAPNSSFRP